MKQYDVAAYVWPAYTGVEPRARIFWEEGIGEWQTVKNSAPKPCGYVWDRKPLWGYADEADPSVMEKQIASALAHGVNVFIYDWYWYDGRPFLEQCLNDGFLKAPNCNEMKFYVMWANHDANYLWDIRNSDTLRETIWKGSVDRKQFEIIGRRWIDQYFHKENYYKIDGKPVVSIYDMRNFILGLGGVEQAKDAMRWLDRAAVEAGLNGVHFQFVRWNGKGQNLTGVDGAPQRTTAALMEKMGFASLTHYQFVHFTDIDRDYEEILPDVQKEWASIADEYRIPYYPHVSVGWDNNPRFKGFRKGIVRNNTPENFKKALIAAKEFADRTNVSLITVNSWNEWTETRYLQPDNLYGYGYLEAIRDVFKK